MPKIPKRILEDKNVVACLTSRGLVSQYTRACKKLCEGQFGGTKIKAKKPKNSGVWSFRINKQFRAIGYRRGDDFVVIKIDNHQ